MTHATLVPLLLAAATVAAAPRPASPLKPDGDQLVEGKVVAGSLGQVTTKSQRFERSHAFEARAMQPVTLVLEPAEAAAAMRVEVFDAAGRPLYPEWDVLAAGPRQWDVVTREAGTHVLRLSGLGPVDYRVTLRLDAPLVPRPLTLGTPVKGRLEPDRAQLFRVVPPPADGRPVQDPIRFNVVRAPDDVDVRLQEVAGGFELSCLGMPCTGRAFVWRATAGERLLWLHSRTGGEFVVDAASWPVPPEVVANVGRLAGPGGERLVVDGRSGLFAQRRQTLVFTPDAGKRFGIEVAFDAAPLHVRLREVRRDAFERTWDLPKGTRRLPAEFDGGTWLLTLEYPDVPPGSWPLGVRPVELGGRMLLGSRSVLPVEGRVAVADLFALVEQSPQGTEEATRLEADRKRFQAELDTGNAALAKEHARLTALGAALTPEERTAYDAAADRLRSRFVDLQARLAATEQAALRRVIGRIDEAVDRIRASRRYELVVDMSAAVWWRPADEITDATFDVLAGKPPPGTPSAGGRVGSIDLDRLAARSRAVAALFAPVDALPEGDARTEASNAADEALLDRCWGALETLAPAKGVGIVLSLKDLVPRHPSLEFREPPLDLTEALAAALDAGGTAPPKP